MIPFILLFWEDVLEVIGKDKRMKSVGHFLASEIGTNRLEQIFSFTEE